MNKELLDKHLNFGVYEATDAFRAIEKHACVCFDDMGLVAVTGRADDEESKRYAELFAAAPELLEELERSTRALEWWKRHHFLEWDAQDDEQLQNNRAAIAKAKGVQS